VGKDHWVIGEERAFLIPFHELTKIIANKIGIVLSFAVIKFFSIGFKSRIWITGRPASQLPKGIFVESKLVRPLETSLPLPFSRNAGLVTCLFYEVAEGGGSWIEKSESDIVSGVRYAGHDFLTRLGVQMG
jgi:hypothetical protein